jgi:hydrogenase small subunit
MKGNPTGGTGLNDFLGQDWKSKAGLPILNVPGCPVQPDNFMETLLYLLRQVAGLAPMIPVDHQAARSGYSGRRCMKATIVPRITRRPILCTNMAVANV